MSSLYLWPDNPALSIGLLWLVSAVFLWAAREPMLELLRGLGRGLETGLRAGGRWCASTAEDLARRSRATLVAVGRLELERKVNRELQRVDASFAEKLGQYSTLHRRVDDLILDLDADYKSCGHAPPELPNWTPAAEAVAGIPVQSGDPNVHKILEGIRGSMRDAEKKALRSYRTDTAKRHGILGRMRGDWREIRLLLSRIHDCVAKALQTSHKIDAYVDQYQGLLRDEGTDARALSLSAMKPFLISLVVLGVALGGAFVNFQLIALPMSELVPAGARLGGIPVSTVSALVIVLMETALGIFLMDMLGITDLFPKLGSLALSRRRLILGLALAGLFFLACVESSLAVLREQIVEAESALKLTLAGQAGQVVAQATNSSIPVIGQAVLGFVLPWILALVAIPLEMLLDSGRHVAAGFGVLVLRGLGHLASALAHAARSFTQTAPSFYDVYIAIPRRIERMVRSREPRDPSERELASARAKGEEAV